MTPTPVLDARKPVNQTIESDKAQKTEEPKVVYSSPSPTFVAITFGCVPVVVLAVHFGLKVFGTKHTPHPQRDLVQDTKEAAANEQEDDDVYRVSVTPTTATPSPGDDENLSIVDAPTPTSSTESLTSRETGDCPSVVHSVVHSVVPSYIYRHTGSSSVFSSTDGSVMYYNALDLTSNPNVEV